eukprot:1541744-Amphidinium_carterae.1
MIACSGPVAGLIRKNVSAVQLLSPVMISVHVVKEPKKLVVVEQGPGYATVMQAAIEVNSNVTHSTTQTSTYPSHGNDYINDLRELNM